jgi:hypothetical protein
METILKNNNGKIRKTQGSLPNLFIRWNETSKNVRCYSVDRPIMRAFHARDWGSNPHSSTFIFH